MSKKRMARRVQPWHPEQPFCCVVHREQAHLTEILNCHPHVLVRTAAAIIFNEFGAIDNGKYGGITVDDLFD